MSADDPAGSACFDRTLLAQLLQHGLSTSPWLWRWPAGTGGRGWMPPPAICRDGSLGLDSEGNRLLLLVMEPVRSTCRQMAESP